MSTKVETPARRRILIVDNHPLIRRGLIDIVDDGLRLLRFIRKRYGDLPVLVLTMHALASYTRLALEAGANGYVTKTEMIETLRSAIHHVIDGETFVNSRFNGEHEIH